MNKTLTHRSTSPNIELLLNQKISMLDHGFIRVIDYMGSDSSIVQAARVSYGEGTKTINEDRGLINYLMKYHHTSPFEMCEIKLHLKMPMFIARQWTRHRTASINEISARYSVLPEEFYVPKKQDIQGQSSTNKQCRGEKLDKEVTMQARKNMTLSAKHSFKEYHNQLNSGVAREIARSILPLSTYTEFYWKIDLHNLLRFLELRSHPHAQFEIREYANKILEMIIKNWVPLTYDAFINYRKNTTTLSSNQLLAIKRMLSNNVVTIENSGLNKREWSEIQDFLKS